MDGMRLQIFGNVGKEPESKYTPQGKMVTTASVATTIGYGDNQKTEWVKIVLWEKAAENFKKLATKGTFIYAEGTPKVSTWLSREGEAQAQIELTVRDFRILKNGAKKEEHSEDEPDFMKD